MTQRHVLLTGATGFIGHYLLADLLRRNLVCVVAMRSVVSSLPRLTAMMAEIGVDLSPFVASGQVIPLELDLSDETFPKSPLPIGAILHAAGSTRFTTDSTGDPQRTNVDGARRLLQWAERQGGCDLHLISTAFACGAVDLSAERPFGPVPPAFHNVYEKSKWEAERLFHEASQRWNRRLTVYRPSIVVGEFSTGRASKFDGFYLMARATELLDRMYRDASRSQRHSIELRIKGRPADVQNIVPVDYVAAAIAGIFENPEWHGRTYHLVHPNPPCNALIKQSLESQFDIAGGRFVEPSHFNANHLSDAEHLFHEVSRPIEHYFVDTPRFDRGRIAEVEESLELACPEYDRAALARLYDYAITTGWGKRKPAGVAGDPGRSLDGCRFYFERFLPDRVPLSRISKLTAMDVTIRFVIADLPDAEWVCQFEKGCLVQVWRGSQNRPADFGYRTDSGSFWRAVSGAAHPQEFFLDGRAEILGNVEQALKMAMILNAFAREHPYDRRSPIQERSIAC